MREWQKLLNDRCTESMGFVDFFSFFLSGLFRRLIIYADSLDQDQTVRLSK